MARTDATAERADRLRQTLIQQRDQGASYPLTVEELRRLAEPEASDADLFAALTKKPHAEAFVLAARKDLASPIALAEDAGRLAESPLLLAYALGKLACPERPLHPLKKIVAQVERPLQPAFQSALEQHLVQGALPSGVGRRDVKHHPHLYLESCPPPPPPCAA